MIRSSMVFYTHLKTCRGGGRLFKRCYKWLAFVTPRRLSAGQFRLAAAVPLCEHSLPHLASVVMIFQTVLLDILSNLALLFCDLDTDDLLSSELGWSPRVARCRLPNLLDGWHMQLGKRRTDRMRCTFSWWRFFSSWSSKVLMPVCIWGFVNIDHHQTLPKALMVTAGEEFPPRNKGAALWRWSVERGVARPEWPPSPFPHSAVINPILSQAFFFSLPPRVPSDDKVCRTPRSN